MRLCNCSLEGVKNRSRSVFTLLSSCISMQGWTDTVITVIYGAEEGREVGRKEKSARAGRPDEKGVSVKVSGVKDAVLSQVGREQTTGVFKGVFKLWVLAAPCGDLVKSQMNAAASGSARSHAAVSSKCTVSNLIRSRIPH